MGEFDNTAVIVYPALWHMAYIPPDKDDLHSTVLWLGDVSDAPYGPADIIGALRGLDLVRYLWASVSGVEWFGPDNNIPVLRVEHSALQIQYDAITTALAPLGAVSASEFGYSPHVTVDEATTTRYPSKILLGPVELWWKNQVFKITDS